MGEPRALDKCFGQTAQRVLDDVGHDPTPSRYDQEDGLGRGAAPPDGWGGPESAERPAENRWAPISRFHGKITGKFVDSGLVMPFSRGNGMLNQAVASQFSVSGQNGNLFG